MSVFGDDRDFLCRPRFGPHHQPLHHGIGHGTKLCGFLSCEVIPASGIDQAERADLVPTRSDQRRPRIEPDLGVAGDERIVAEPRVCRCVENDHHIVASDGVVAERDVAGRS